MNTGTFVCTFSSLLFFLFALVFTFLKGKAAILISGFNTIPKQEREQYDKEKMSRAQRNSFLIWAIILGIGAFLCQVLSGYMAIPTFVIWLIVVLKDVHFDDEKAFGKYRK